MMFPNFDPNDPYSGGSYNPGGAPVVADPYVPPAPTPAPAADPLAWTTDPNATPPWQVPGQEWFWNGSRWQTRNVRPTGGIGTTGIDPVPTTYPQATPRPSGGGIDIGRPSGSLLPFTGYESAGAFGFDPYTPSSWEDAENEPGFGKSQDRLSKQVQNSAAYRGVLRSGMTIGNLDSVLDSNRQQNFSQFDDRRFRNWNANTGFSRDAFGFRATDVDRKNNYNFNVADRSFADELARWTQQVQSLTSLARPLP